MRSVEFHYEFGLFFIYLKFVDVVQQISVQIEFHENDEFFV